MDGFTPATPEEAATQAIRDYCGWHVAPVIDATIILDGTGTDTVLLPSRRVTAVESVTVDGHELASTAYEWSADGLLRRRDGGWPDRYRVITVELKHGFASMAVLADVVASIVARVRMDPTGALANQRAGTQSVGFASGSAGGGLMQSEKARLEPYRLTWGP